MLTQFNFEAIGTTWQIDIGQNLSREEESDLLSKIIQRIGIFDKNYSRFRPDSLVTLMSQKAGEYVLPDDAPRMMNLYFELFFQTGGLLTPLIGQVMEDAGYDPTYSLIQKKELEKPPRWEDVLEYNHPKLVLKQPVLLDFGAAGKGYLIDIVGEVLEGNGVYSFCIDAGGDILHRSQSNEVLRVGLENPEDFSQVIGVANLSNKSLCASSGSRRKWKGISEDFHHIINPDTLLSPKDIIGTWVIADTTLLADAIATCLFFVSPETLTKWYDFQYIVLYSDFSVLKSDGFTGEIFGKS